MVISLAPREVEEEGEEGEGEEGEGEESGPGPPYNVFSFVYSLFFSFTSFRSGGLEEREKGGTQL